MGEKDLFKMRAEIKTFKASYRAEKLHFQCKNNEIVLLYYIYKLFNRQYLVKIIIINIYLFSVVADNKKKH